MFFRRVHTITKLIISLYETKYKLNVTESCIVVADYYLSLVVTLSKEFFANFHTPLPRYFPGSGRVAYVCTF